MSLQPWMVQAGWKPGCFAVYRPSKGRVTHVVAVPGCGSVPGRRKATSNFDTMKSFAGQSNQDSLMTSDELRFPIGYDVRAGDAVRLLETDEWFVVAGAPTRKTAVPQLARQVAYVTTTTPPLIASGEWSDG